MIAHQVATQKLEHINVQSVHPDNTAHQLTIHLLTVLEATTKVSQGSKRAKSVQLVMRAPLTKSTRIQQHAYMEPTHQSKD